MAKLPDLDQITAFLAVAEALSFRRAAERLAIDQSALSRRIKDLEHRVGCQLLTRTTHAVRLTDSGRSFYETNAALVSGLTSAVDRARRIARGQSGSLSIAYMTFAAVRLLPEALSRFAGSHPDVAVTLAYERTQGQKLSLARGSVDLGLMLGPFEHSDFETLELTREPLVVLMREDHPLATAAAPTLAEIAAHDLVLGDEVQWDFYRGIVVDHFAAKGLEPRIAQEAPSLTGIVGLVRAGIGVTLVPEVMRDAVPPGLVIRPIADATSPIVTLAAWRRPASGPVAEMVAALSAIASGRCGPAHAKIRPS